MIVDHFSDSIKIPAKKKHAAQLVQAVLRAFRGMTIHAAEAMYSKRK